MVLPPDVPREVQIIQEDDQFVMRTLDGEKSLYTYDQDAQGESECTDRCAEDWPPLYASAGEKPVDKWSVINRPDGSLQWAFKGRPVYTFAQDPEGFATGDGIGGVWHLLPAVPVK